MSRKEARGQASRGADQRYHVVWKDGTAASGDGIASLSQFPEL
jgi:hypothetical protein